MTYPFVIAEIGIDGIIWLVIALLWGLAQIFGLSKKKKPMAHPPVRSSEDRPETESVNEQIRELFESLTGTTLPPPPPPKPPAPKKRSTPAKAPIARPVTEHAAAFQEAPPLPGLDAIYGEGAAQLSLSQRTVLLPGITSFKLRTMKLASLGVPGSLRTHRPVGQIRPHLQGRKNLRTAMLSRILLGPPRSMDPNG